LVFSDTSDPNPRINTRDELITLLKVVQGRDPFIIPRAQECLYSIEDAHNPSQPREVILPDFGTFTPRYWTYHFFKCACRLFDQYIEPWVRDDVDEASDFEDVFAVNIDPDEVLTRSRAMVAMLRTLGIDPDTHAAVLMFLNRIRWPMVWDPLTRGMGSYREAWLRGRAVGQGEDMEAPAGTHLRRFKLGTSIPAIAHDLQKCFDMLLTGPKLDGAFMLPIPDNPYPPRENNKSKFMKCDRCTNMSILGPAHPVSHAEGEHIYKRRKD
jgi:hypothetical protein